ncbi:hypothetical protein QZH41_014911 [Actinostola sp. cb2023]|nr:hypothetical protein QZH41_014911 [Actinostola sp. cb2023]
MTVKNHGARHGTVTRGTDSFEILNHHGHGTARPCRSTALSHPRGRTTKNDRARNSKIQLRFCQTGNYATAKSVTAIFPNKRCIRGIGFDATCSLVALNSNGQPVSVSKSQDPQRNVIMWLDHRAIKQAERINSTTHEVLRYVGGVLSPEMQAAKLLWIKENLPTCWESTSVFLDLPEYLTFKATGDPTRSTCSLVCKFNYMSHETQMQTGESSTGNQGLLGGAEGTQSGWVDSYWQQIGLQDLPLGKYSKLGTITSTPGTPIGNGLTKNTAEQIGLWEGCPVGCSLIDAHAGGIGVIGADVTGSGLPCANQPITTRLVLVCGTSTCHMAISENPIFVQGVWGPYYSAMVPGLWLNEGGQSATGKLVMIVWEVCCSGSTITQGLKIIEEKVLPFITTTTTIIITTSITITIIISNNSIISNIVISTTTTTTIIITTSITITIINNSIISNIVISTTTTTIIITTSITITISNNSIISNIVISTTTTTTIIIITK